MDVSDIQAACNAFIECAQRMQQLASRQADPALRDWFLERSKEQTNNCSAACELPLS